MMHIDADSIKRILVITLSNVGDIVLTIPVVRTLRARFPKARIDVMVGPQGREVFEKDPSVTKVIVYDKHATVTEKGRMSAKLRRLKYELVVDLRNTIFGLLLGPKYRTSTIMTAPKSIRHRIDAHLWKLTSLGIAPIERRGVLHIPHEDAERIDALLSISRVKESFAVLVPGAKSHLKRWPEESFALLAERIVSEMGIDVVLTGSREEYDISERIVKKAEVRLHNFAGRTTLRELGALLRRATVVVTNDSGPLHIACAVGTRVLALFGPTDHKKYGPTGNHDAVVHKDVSCAPCEAAVCANNYECMRTITPAEVFEALERIIPRKGRA